MEDTIKDFWSTRPRRPRRGRKIAGVAAGIAQRYRIDPTLVRVALVVAAIYGGAGIVVYLLGWLLLPEEGDEVSPFEGLIGKGRSSTSSGFTVLLCVAFIPTFSWFFSGVFPGYIGLLVVGGLLILLHHSRGNLAAAGSQTAQQAPVPNTPVAPEMPFMPQMPNTATAPVADPAPAEPTVTPTAQSVPLTTEPPAAAQFANTGIDDLPETRRVPEYPTTPPAWDPLGAAPFAWDLPDPNPPQPEPEPPVRRRRSRVGLMTVGAALIVGAAMAMLSTEQDWITEQRIIGVVLAVLGLGMVAGSFVRGGRGLIGLAVPLAAVGIGLTAVAPDGNYSVGDVAQRPTTSEEVLPMYERTAGSIYLDLSALPDVGHVSTNVVVGVGDATVILPEGADVEVTCRAPVGDVECLGRTSSGFDNELARVGSDGTGGPGGLTINLHVEVNGAGNVEVVRHG